MKYILLIILSLVIAGCCGTSGITYKNELKYTYRDSISYILKADTFKIYDTIPFINFFPYVASASRVQERIVYRTDGTFRKKYDSLNLQYSLLDSTFNVVINSSPDSVYKEIKTVTITKESYTKIIASFIIGIIAGFLASIFNKRK